MTWALYHWLHVINVFFLMSEFINITIIVTRQLFFYLPHPHGLTLTTLTLHPGATNLSLQHVPPVLAPRPLILPFFVRMGFIAAIESVFSPHSLLLHGWLRYHTWRRWSRLGLRWPSSLLWSLRWYVRRPATLFSPPSLSPASPPGHTHRPALTRCKHTLGLEHSPYQK